MCDTKTHCTSHSMDGLKEEARILRGGKEYCARKRHRTSNMHMLFCITLGQSCTNMQHQRYMSDKQTFWQYHPNDACSKPSPNDNLCSLMRPGQLITTFSATWCCALSERTIATLCASSRKPMSAVNTRGLAIRTQFTNHEFLPSYKRNRIAPTYSVLSSHSSTAELPRVSRPPGTYTVA
jgi:hypothetical protein